ncbi:MAG: long-chain-fatty-acid--CoA ligase [Deltaproteobacteria bacterium]|nr:long-chain-fatty-acid--CoA ligase [Deltaproteobacteria bacterium]
MLIRDILARNARIHPERIALSLGREDITYRELSARASRYASVLQGLGVGKGDRVAVLTHNSPLYVELLYAITQIGGVLVPLNYLLLGRELSAILRRADAKVLLFAAEFQSVAEGIRAALPSIPHFVCIDRPLEGYGDLAEMEARVSGISAAPVPLSESDIAIQIYTSGTGGVPRGAMLSHRNMVAASVSAALELRLSRNDIYLSAAPLPFMAGTGRLLRFQYMGGTVVLLRDFDPEEVLRTIEQRRITHVLLTPTMIARILDLPSAGRYNLATLRTVLYGGSTIPVELQKRAIRFFRCGMVQIYGQVESAGVLTFLHAEDHSLEESAPYMRKLMSVGKEAIGVEARVVDEAGREISPNQVGEIVARGLNIFEGYYRDPSSTAEVLRNGWLYTGDVASVDEEGYIYIVDRKRDTMMVGGISVSPKEIEEVIEEHPAVKEAAVVARLDYELGEVPAAIVVLKEGERADPEALLAHCRENMAPYKIPRLIEFIPSLPRNSQGKILKAKLRERVVSGSIPRTPRR